MTNKEFSNEFDVLYNNITSNLAPGLDEYEKSVFLTKAQDEVVKDYFNPKANKVLEGYDDNERRLIDFSMIMRSKVYDENTAVVKPLEKSLGDNTDIDDTEPMLPVITSSFGDSFFDMRDNTKSVALDADILMFVNEYAVVSRATEGGATTVRLTILPINYNEYSRLMSKPFKRPLKYQAWRLLDNSAGQKKAELVIGPNDSLKKYVIRYVKRPRAIRLTDFTSEDTSIDGEYTEQSCELDPILHQEILQRAVELAKASYAGDLSSQIALGTNSQTPIGMVTQSR